MAKAKKSTNPLARTSDQIKDAFHQALRSRMFWLIMILGFIEMLVMVIMTITHLRSGMAVKTHCEVLPWTDTATDCTSSDAPWYYVLNFAILPIVVLVCNYLIGLKLLAVKGRTLALCWLWLSLLIGLVITVLGGAMVTHVV